MIALAGGAYGEQRVLINTAAKSIYYNLLALNMVLIECCLLLSLYLIMRLVHQLPDHTIFQSPASSTKCRRGIRVWLKRVVVAPLPELLLLRSE